MHLKITSAILASLLLSGCDHNVYTALDTLTEQSTGHVTTATMLLDANSLPPDAVVASSASSAAPVVQTVVEASSSSVYVPPLTESCLPGEKLFRVWDCGPGYGKFRLAGIRTRLAPRISWILHKGPIPEGLLICHKCDQPSCVNPDHLYPGTDQDNTNDKIARGRVRVGICFGENKGPSKLKADEAYEIRRRWKAGEIRAALAREYGVGYMTVQAICQNRTWKEENRDKSYLAS